MTLNIQDFTITPGREFSHWNDNSPTTIETLGTATPGVQHTLHSLFVQVGAAGAGSFNVQSGGVVIFGAITLANDEQFILDFSEIGHCCTDPGNSLSLNSTGMTLDAIHAVISSVPSTT